MKTKTKGMAALTGTVLLAMTLLPAVQAQGLRIETEAEVQAAEPTDLSNNIYVYAGALQAHDSGILDGWYTRVIPIEEEISISWNDTLTFYFGCEYTDTDAKWLGDILFLATVFDPSGNALTYAERSVHDTPIVGDSIVETLYCQLPSQLGEGTYSVSLLVLYVGLSYSCGLSLIHVHVDTAPPVTAIKPSQEVNGWWSGPISLEATDGLSGVNRTYYCLDNGTWTEYTEPFNVSDSNHTISFYSVDNAGNTEAVNEVGFNMDSTGPTIASDASSEIDGVEFYVDGKLISMVYGDPYQWLFDCSIFSKDFHQIKAVAYDNAGNFDVDKITVEVI